MPGLLDLHLPTFTHRHFPKNLPNVQVTCIITQLSSSSFVSFTTEAEPLLEREHG